MNYILNWGGFGVPVIPSQPKKETKRVRCPGCGGDYDVSNDFIENLPTDVSKVKFPCKYSCKVSVKSLVKRFK